MAESEILIGSITNYIYQSTDSLYKVCLLKVEGKADEITIVGSFPRLEDGLNYEFVGKFKEHPKYGKQFFVESYAKSKSFTKEGLVSYLSSDKFKGIGKKLATKIVDELGMECIDKILDDKHILDNIEGVTPLKAKAIYHNLKDNYKTEQVFIKLYGFGLTSKMIYRLYDEYGNNAANKIEENPYRLIYEVEGFGFKKSDALALNLGFKEEDIVRIKAAIKYTINYICFQEGFTFITHEQLVNSCMGLLNNNPNIDEILINKAIDELKADDELIVSDEDYYYEPKLYKAENELASKLVRIKQATGTKYDEKKLKETLEQIKRESDINYTPLQEDAILSSMQNKLSIITGGPGTGKSTILDGILKLYAAMEGIEVGNYNMTLKVLLCAPTGRAAKRMAEATNFKASTIHRALNYNYEGGFSSNETNPLTISLLIIDEASMLDISLAASLFKALPNTVRVILIGDANQLPSVGPGNVLHDLIESEMFKTTKLTQIMRQAKDSDIINLSHMVLNERISYDIFSKRKEIYYYEAESKNITDIIFRILDSFIASGGDLFSGIQVLIPMYAGVAGIDAINAAIQERYNKETEKFIKRDELLFKKGDKVLQLKNDPKMKIMNGDLGKIMDIVKQDDKDAMVIDFDGLVVTYPVSEIDNLRLAYAMSIHKSQGSEFDNVIIPVLPSYNIMLKKKLIYTAITRAKKKLIFLGKLDSLAYATTRVEYQRQTTLYQRIKQENDGRSAKKIFDPDIPFDTFGEYDMDGITPYTFMDN